MSSFKSQDHNQHSFDVNTNRTNFSLSQDISAYTDYAKESRDSYEYFGGGNRYRSFAVIPDIVAIDILTKYKIDINASDFMSDKQQVERLKKIIISEYPALLTYGNTRRKQKRG